MAENPIKNTDFYDGDGKPFSEVFKDFQRINAEVLTLTSNLKTLVTGLKKVGTAGNSKMLKEERAAILAVEEATTLLAKKETERAKAELEVQKAVKLKIQADVLAKQNVDKLIDAEKKELGTLEQLRVANKKLTSEKNGLNLKTKEGRERLKELNDELTRNKKQLAESTDGHGKMMQSYFKLGEGLRNVGTKLVALGGIVAAGKVVWEAFTSVMLSTGASADKFNFAIAGVKGGFNSMLESLANGETSLTKIWNNMKTGAKAGYDLADALDSIEEKQLAANYQESKNALLLSELFLKAKNATLSIRERSAAVNEYVKISKEDAKVQLNIQAETTQAYLKNAQARTKLKQADIEWYFSVKGTNVEREKANKFSLIENLLMTKLGEDTYKVLVESMTNYQNKKASYNEENKRILATQNTLNAELTEFEKKESDKRIAQLEKEKKAREEINKPFKEAQTKLDATKKAGRLAGVKYTETASDETKKQQQDAYKKQLEQEQKDIEATNELMAQKKLEREQRIQKEKEQIFSASAQIVGDIQTIVSNQQQAKIKEEQDALQAKYDMDIKLAGNNATKKAAIEAKFAKDKLEIEKKQYRQSQQLAIANAVVTGAQALLYAALIAPPVSFVTMATVAGITAAQIGVIASQKFEKGGSFIEGGRRHSQGGNRYGNIETEQGERHSIFSRDATKYYGDTLEHLTNSVNDKKLDLFSLNFQKTPSVYVNNNNTEMVNIAKKQLDAQHKTLYVLQNQKQVIGNMTIDAHGNKTYKV